MFHLSKTLVLTAAIGSLSFATAASVANAKDDEYWGGYWKWYDGTYRNYYNRPHNLRYGDSEPTLYYGHAPPRKYDSATQPPYRRGEPPHIGGYSPIYGPGHYNGPSIDPYYAPGRARYAGVRYGWW